MTVSGDGRDVFAVIRDRAFRAVDPGAGTLARAARCNFEPAPTGTL